MGILITVVSGFALALAVPWLHRRGTSVTGWALAVLPLALAIYLAGWIPRIAAEGAVRIEYPWMPGLDVNLSFLVDGLSLFFALLVCVVGVAIFIYSGPYVKEDEHGGRFYSYMLGFMASMLGLILADNVFALYIFFEATTVASFLLIGYRYDEKESRAAAWQALLVTTAGGFALMAGFILMGDAVGAYETSAMLEAGDVVQESGLYLPILLLVLTGAFSKSAQFPFYFWLPNAMAAPSPVSAYLHSATMVKAGIYLLARFSPVLGDTEAWLSVVTAVGGVTMLIAAYLALRYTEMKKMLAYSTIMALGTMTMLLGLGGEEAVLACMAFVLVHALYKAPLFMVAGTLEHEAGSYDLAELGGLGKALPLTFGAAVLAAISMAGLPPFLGWASKEAILTTLSDADVWPHLLSAAAVLSNGAIFAVAGVVSLRPFLGKRKHPGEEVHRAPFGLWISPLLLGGLGLFFGLTPDTVSQHLLEPAVLAVAEEPVSEQLALWHGFTTAFFLSLASIALGVGLTSASRRLRGSSALRSFAAVFADGLDSAYEVAMKGLTGVASWQTRILQHGILRHYVAVSVGFGVLLIGYTAIARGGVLGAAIDADVLPYEAAAAALLVTSAVAVIVVKHRFTAVLALSALGFSVAAIYLVFSAPDVALVQLLIETLTLILVILALIDMPGIYREPERDRWRYRNLGIAVGLGAVVALLMLVILELPFDESISDFYINESRGGAGGHNVLNNILVDFRALDTLGEITVLVVAGFSAYTLVRRRKSVDDSESIDSPNRTAS